MSYSYGAGFEAWIHFDLILGLTEDLLPVVSDPGAQISEHSSLKTLGKTPSLFNRSGKAIGIPRWTEHVADSDDVERWSKDDRLGICLQTRRVRAIDIDVPDASISAEIVAFINTYLDGGPLLPRRFRVDSGKCLLLFELPCDYRKGVMKVDGGIVEFLAGGNQCVVSGTHPNGARYEWEGGLPMSVPALSAEQFEGLWAALEARFALEPSTRLRAVEKGEDLGLSDEVAEWLVENWETYGLGRDGRRLFVRCPWKDVDHSSDSGETEAAWLIRGTGGKEQGHFRCLHAHCNERGRSAFLTEVGYEMAGFDVVETGGVPTGGGPVEPGQEPLGGALDVPWEALERKKKKNQDVPDATIGNVVIAVGRPDKLGWRVAFDTFRSEMMLAPAGTDDWIPIDDDDITEFRMVLAQKHNFFPIAKDMMRDAVGRVGKYRQFDAAQLWLDSLPDWDGVLRVHRFMTDYMGCADTPYAAAVGTYMWSAHAGRIMDPGCKADMAPILVGGQGVGKSRGVAAISPSPDFFVEIGFHEKDDDLSRKMRGTLVAEIAELRGLNSKDAQTIKAQMSRQFEKWTPKFKEYKTAFPRRLMFWGTSNEDEILADSTGERRWLPIKVEHLIDVDRIILDRKQLWAEGLMLWRTKGVIWADAERLGRDEHGKFKVTDPWEELIAGWLEEPSGDDMGGVTNRACNGLAMQTVATMALGLDATRFGTREQIRIGKILRHLGMASISKRVGGVVRRTWISIL